jgi:hypothetical protein
MVRWLLDPKRNPPADILVHDLGISAYQFAQEQKKLFDETRLDKMTTRESLDYIMNKEINKLLERRFKQLQEVL